MPFNGRYTPPREAKAPDRADDFMTSADKVLRPIVASKSGQEALLGALGTFAGTAIGGPAGGAVGGALGKFAADLVPDEGDRFLEGADQGGEASGSSSSDDEQRYVSGLEAFVSGRLVLVVRVETTLVGAAPSGAITGNVLSVSDESVELELKGGGSTVVPLK